MLGIILVHAVLMTIFVYDLVKRQSDFLHAQSIAQVTSLTKTLAVNSSSWVVANDVIGLEEVLQAQTSYPDLKYAMVLSLDGRVLGHTDVNKAGLYVSDDVSRKLLKSAHQQHILVDTINLVDIAAPIFINDKVIGWARVGLGQDKIVSGLQVITRDGLLYTLIAIVVGALFAFFMAKGITQGLQQIVDVAEGVKRGDLQLRSELSRKDELGHLAEDINIMLDTIAESKRDMQVILDHSPALIYAKDIDGKYVFVNQKFTQVFAKPGGDIIGQTDAEIFSKEFSDKLISNDKEVLVSGNEIESEEIVPLADGLHTYATVKFPLINEKGIIYAVCGISTDITLRKKEEKNLRHIQKMDALGKLTGGIAHDYNNMLGIVLGYTELLIGMCDDNSDAERHLKSIQHAGERGAKLTKKLLSFSKDTDSEKDIVYLNDFLKEESQMLEKVLTARVQLVLAIDDNLWPVWIERSDLEDAVINMCINAMHAMNGEGKLTIESNNITLDQDSAKLLELPPGDYVVTSFVDTGCGMDEDTMEKIFDPFFSTKGEQGTGLGLSQIYGLIESSGGAIKVHSEVGKGTEFVLYLPRYSKEIVKSKAKHKSPTNPTNLTGTETILIVDDEPIMLKLVTKILQMQGYTVINAESAQQALELFETTPIDLLLSDVFLSGADGYELAEIVKQQYPAVKVQLASGLAAEHHKRIDDETLQKNMLIKPYDAHVLLSRVRELLD